MGTCERGQKSKAHKVLGASSIDDDFRLHCGGFQDPTHVPQILEMAGSCADPLSVCSEVLQCPAEALNLG